MVSLTRLAAAVLALTSVADARPNPTTRATDDLALVAQRRRVDMAGFATGPLFAQIDTWLGSQTANGTWPDVNYASGCAARELSRWWSPS